LRAKPATGKWRGFATRSACTIEERRDRIADRIKARHNSIGGRLAALTKKGREKQAAELQRLDDRAEQLQARAHRNYQALTERQFQAEQRDRTLTAQHIKFFRLENLEMRQQHLKEHQASREQKIEARTQEIQRQTAERLLQAEMQRTREQADERSRTLKMDMQRAAQARSRSL
jgi:uncharacterized protein YbjQ (UPF0145 family)